MTLIIGRTTPIGARISGDMRITRPDVTPGFLDAALKVILLTPTLCVAYSGLVGPALTAIREALPDADDPDAVCERLNAHSRSDECDFLFGAVRPPRLVVIKAGKAVETPASWLGDYGAFVEYQRYYHGATGLLISREDYGDAGRWEDVDIATRIGDGFDAVINGPAYELRDGQRVLLEAQGGAHPSVGEGVVHAAPLLPDDLFGYTHQLRFDASPSADAEAGRYSLLTPEQRGVGAVGLHFHEGRLGVLYAPLRFTDPELFPKVSKDAFVELVQTRHGIRLSGLG